MRSPHSCIALLVCLGLSICITGAACAQALGKSALDSTGEFEFALRQASVSILQQSGSGPTPTPAMGGSVTESLARAKYGLRSLFLPGWSQYEAGNNRRAIGFISAEVAIWSTWAFSKMQGRYREDKYSEYAQEFAGVRGSDHDEEYWRIVGRYRDYEEFNESVRRENRVSIEDQERAGDPVTIGIHDGTLAAADGWNWTSIQRRTEYHQLRADALTAFDRADLVLVFALLNRIISFTDAVRTGPGDIGDGRLGLMESGGFELSVGIDPNPLRPGGTLLLGRGF